MRFRDTRPDSSTACPTCQGDVAIHSGGKRWQCLAFGCGAGGGFLDGAPVVSSTVGRSLDDIRAEKMIAEHKAAEPELFDRRADLESRVRTEVWR